jgi:hypothetical protein
LYRGAEKVSGIKAARFQESIDRKKLGGLQIDGDRVFDQHFAGWHRLGLGSWKTTCQSSAQSYHDRALAFDTPV